MPVEETESLSFEAALSRLEDTVARLETGGLTIEEMVERFEEGMLLVKHCSHKLDTAQARIHVLMREHGGLEDLDTADEINP